MEHYPNISYLISRYPAISHTFILREVLHLKSKGLRINTASINSTDRPDQGLTEEERSEKSTTYYIKDQGLKGVLKSLLYGLKNQPKNILSAFLYTFKLSDTNLKQWVYNLFYFLEACIVAQWMGENKSRHLHIHFGSQVATVGLFVKKINHCKLSIYIHGPDEFYDAMKYQLEEKINVADKIFCISDYARSQMMKLSSYTNWDKFEVCRLGVNPNIFIPAKKADNAIKTVLCVGRLCPAKGQHILLLAMKKIHLSGQMFKLVLVGEGEDTTSLKSLSASLGLSDSVEFTGAVNHDEVHKYYQQSDIFCLPSFAEGIPIVLMEAMAQEIACITTRITGIPELIDDGVDGLLVAPSNIEELSATITHLLTSNTTRKAIGKAARKKVKKHYDVSKNTDYFAEKLSRYLAE